MRFNFVVSRSVAEIAALLEAYRDTASALRTDIFSSGELAWCLQTFAILARRGRLDVACSNAIDPMAVNLVHSDTMLRLRPDPRAFVVCVRSDYPKRQWANHHVVQNRDQLKGPSSYVPHWPQAGLLARAEGRRGVARAAYVGQVDRNLAGSVAAWRETLAAHGIEFHVPDRQGWHDMREIDALIAIRSFDRNPHSSKPPSKIFNAWRAGIPFIGGNDSAYRQVGRPGTDYLVATTPAEALDHVLRLKRDTALYDRLVANGRARAQHYDEAHIAEAWEVVLGSEVAARFAAWKSSRLEPARFAAGLVMGLGLHHARRMGRAALGALSGA